MFNEHDIAQIEARGISVERVEQQIANFRNGFPSLPVVRAAAGGDGVKQLNEEEVKSAEVYYTERAASLRQSSKWYKCTCKYENGHYEFT